MLLQNFIRSVLSERSRYEKETGRTVTDDIRSKLMSLASDAHPAQYAFTMTDVERIGINPKTGFETPAGVYFYPLTKDYCQKLFNNRLPFAGDRKFVGLVKLRGLDTSGTPGKWLKFINQGQNFATDAELQAAVDVSEQAAIAMQTYGKHKNFNNDAKIFDIGYFSCHRLKNRPTVAWNTFLRQLGYIGIYDAGNGIIHPSEPTQLTCLSPAAYQIVDIFETAEIRNKRNIGAGSENFDYDAWYAKLTYHEKLVAAGDPDTRKKLLLMLSKDINTEVRRAVACHPSVTPSILRNLSNDQDPYVRNNVASHPKTPPDVLLQLALSKNIDITYRIVNNLSTPPEALLILSDHSSVNVRSAVASHASITSEIFHKLSKDNSSDVRLAVARNTHTPPEVLLDLSKDQDPSVRAYTAANPLTPVDALAALSKDSTFIRNRVAQNMSTPMEILQQLSRDESFNVKISAVETIANLRKK